MSGEQKYRHHSIVWANILSPGSMLITAILYYAIDAKPHVTVLHSHIIAWLNSGRGYCAADYLGYSALIHTSPHERLTKDA